MPIDMVGVSFEYEDVPQRNKLYRDEKCRYFVTVLSECNHYYTGNTTYEVRIEYGDILADGYVERKYVSQFKLEEMWKNRIKEGEN